MTRHETGYLSQKPRLYYQAWHPPQDAHGVLIIAHGLGGHGGQFLNVAPLLVDAQLAVYALDFRGHGQSEGPRGYVKHWKEYLQDLNQILTLSQDFYPGFPIFLWGHSLGGLIALDYALRGYHTLAGLILSAPAVGRTGISPFMFALGQLLSWVWPRFSLDVGLDSRACSRDPIIVKHYNADPLHHSRGTARLSTEFQNAQSLVQERLAHLHTPTLILHGGGDRITSPKSSVQLYESMQMSDRKLIQYPHAYHELHLDINREKVLSDITHWINSQLKDRNLGK